jgi:hypothetical protein
MESSTDSSIENYDYRNYDMTYSDGGERLTPEYKLTLSDIHSNSGNRSPTKTYCKHGTRKFISTDISCVAQPIGNIIPSGPSSKVWRNRIEVLIAPFT